MNRLHKFQLLTKEQLEQSPSLRDNVPPNMEHRRRKLAAQHMKAVSCRFKM